ncbi:acetyl-CoA C-acyltransferase [Mucilaginibacter polytrichastri]|uniref:acetyl-CoA C-acyltransferase n=1 Tax=Mucilaginibacter polytrichastri TaxID=1302689 RepID=A0A1Q5ZYK8_9SPHI|nr:acetyl-CoA C-acyltransferase [Mucilaginibacter polytrichastri]OKS86829.1 3-ketoacyl-CoA thiolase [Mucilaginibacter polytrichastri]SFT17268.1 acetyl-CoA acyltransferase [Mucilaginibacter polytrichastri]
MNAYIVAASRSAVGKATRGGFRFTRPDTLAADVIKHLVASVPNVDKEQIEDVIVGNATPEAEQGLNVARLISLMALDTDKVPGMTVNRYCASGLETIAIASAKIHSGIADCIIAGGVESMSLLPMGGWRIVPNADVAIAHPDYYWGMGLTAEAVAKEYNIGREEQDQFAYQSHQKAISAISGGRFKNQIVPVTVSETYVDEKGKRKTRDFTIDTDEGPRADTSIEALAKLKPVFDAKGMVTAGNSSQTSDGAAFVMVVSERFMKQNNLTPIARLVNYAVVGVPPRIMGIGPLYAIPEVLKKSGLKQDDIDLFELNEAFASQSLAVIKGLNLNQDIVNVNGGAIALGHPLGCSGAKLSVQLFDELKQRDKKYGMVTMCVGTGQGAAGIFELLN